MIYCFDIDGTICTNTNGKYEEAQPNQKIIKIINHLYSEDNTIYFYTARGATTGINWREKTEKQLIQWGVNYHQLYMGKPSADIYIDDKCINIKDWK